MLSLSARELHKQFIERKLSAVQIVTAYLQQIHAHNDSLGAFITTLDERALQKAKELDQKRDQKKPLGRLAAIPIGIKDNIHIEGETTTCASKFLTNYEAPFSASVTKALEEEDAILIGKMNMDEFAMGSSNENSAFFPAKNPWNQACVPGGSSGGSAAAVAARLVPITLGSDTGGSIRQPASFCGVFGFKPTYGRVSRFGLVAFGSSFDQIGPFTYDIEDLAMVMNILAKPCDRDSTSLKSPAPDFSKDLPKDLKGKKIGVPWQVLQDLEPEAKKNFEESIERFKELGAAIVEVDLSIIKHSIAVYYILSTAEASTNLARFDGIRYGARSKSAKTLSDIYDESRNEGFGTEVKQRILLGTYLLSAGHKEAFYQKAQKVRTLIIQAFDEAFKECDVITMPVCPMTAFGANSIKDPVQMYLQDIFTTPANLAGIPAISIPSGFDQKKMPFGLQILAPQEEDKRVIDFAYAYDQKAKFSQKIPEHFAKAKSELVT